jgi:riboflavin synthase
VTSLGSKQVGDVVNLENDVVGKYVEKLLDPRKGGGSISREFLARNGFID